jgi:WD40 repeat protein
MELTESGSALACSTSEGCTIHIYNTEDGTKLKDYSRGSIPAHINLLSFQLNDSRLLVGSDTGTLHIFVVEEDVNPEVNEDHPHNLVSSFSFLSAVIPYLGRIGSY